MKWFGFHSFVTHNPVIPHGYILFILHIEVFKSSVMAVSDSLICLIADTVLHTYVRWTENNANHFMRYSREKWDVIVWTNDSKGGILISDGDRNTVEFGLF